MQLTDDAHVLSLLLIATMLAHLLQTTQSLETPLQRRLEQLGKILIIIALLLTAMVVAAGVLQGYDIYTMFLSRRNV